jgi:hypothetical protein
MKITKSINTSMSLAVAMAILSVNAQATVTYVGFQSEIESAADTPGTGWRNAAPVKTFDIDGDNILGTDGYWNPSNSSALPAYVASASKQNVGNDNTGSVFGVMDDPGSPGGTDTWNFGGWRHNSTTELEMATVTLSANAGTLLNNQTLRVGWLSDIYNFSGSFFMRASLDSGGDSGLTPLISYADNGLDAGFFDISNVADGDVIRLYGTANTGSWAVMGGLTFDTITNPTAIPEPSSTALLGLGGLALMLRRRR